MLTAIGAWALRRSRRSDPWTNVYGVGRSMLALATAASLALTDPRALFHPAPGMHEGPFCSDALTRAGFFCTLPSSRLEWMRWAAVAILAVVASGWRPRLTALPHWWITTSFAVNATLIEGGDQVAMALSLFLLPVALTDGRKWHWDAPLARQATSRDDAKRIVAGIGHTLVRAQVAVVYFHAAVGKVSVEEWKDGTVLYYWLLHPTFGAPHWLEPYVRALVLNGTIVALLTWSVILLEYVLSAALFMPKRSWKYPFVGGIALHAGIILLHGLASFGFIMFAALLLFLRPWERPLRLSLRRLSGVRSLFARPSRSRPRFAEST